MKLGVILDRVRTPLGGAERHTLALMRRAAENGDQAVLATLEGGLTPGVLPEGVDAIEVEARHRRPRRDAVFARDAARALRAAGCDVVLAIRHAPDCDVYFPHGGLVGDARAAKAQAGGGASVWRRIFPVGQRKFAFFEQAERALLGGAEGPLVIAVSNMTAHRIRRVYPTCAQRVQTVVNGVDVDHFERAPHVQAGRDLRSTCVPDGAYVALLMAHQPTLKGVRAAIKALARPEVLGGIDRPVHLLVAGGRLDRASRRLVRSEGVADRVHVLGSVADPRPLYAAADVLLHPTWYDPCSLVCLEALAMGLPVITTPRNGVREVLGQRGGIVLEGPGRPEAIAVALRVLSDPALHAFTADDARYLAMRNRESTRLDQVLDLCRGRVDPA